MTFSSIDFVCHSDWSVNPRKRWFATAKLQDNYRWRVSPPKQVSDPATFFSDLQSLSSSAGCILAGFDFPIGLPAQYAYAAGIKDFLATLPYLGHGKWHQFYQPAETPDQISIYRPFYPRRPGNAKRLHLEQGLNLSFNHIYRLCELAHNNRRAACPLFWTLGGQQVGKAAIHGWKELLAPSLSRPDLHLKIWPFSGHLAEICLPGNIVAVETYPAEYYVHLDILRPVDRTSKRSLSGRKYYAMQLFSWADLLRMDLDNTLHASILDGFGDHLNGEDQFDALIGLYGMINVLAGNHPAGEPLTPQASKVEGWIFGQEQLGSDI